MAAILQLIAALLPAGGNAVLIDKILAALVAIYPIVVSEYHDLVPIVKNIITALRSDPTTLPDQLDALDKMEEQLDADFEAAATAAAAEDAAAAAAKS